MFEKFGIVLYSNRTEISQPNEGFNNMSIIDYLNEVPMTTIFVVAAVVGPLVILGFGSLQDRFKKR